jgi:hypothetical protein
MKKVFTYLVTFIMAALVFYGGAGINLISYCCNLCSMEGIEAVTNGKCCDIHHHHHSDNHASHYDSYNCTAHHASESHTNHHDSHCCTSACDMHTDDDSANDMHDCCTFSDEHDSGNCCSLKRISFDWFANNLLKQEVDLSPVTMELFACCLPTISPILDTEKLAPEPHGPPIVLPRDYLSTLTVLLI